LCVCVCVRACVCVSLSLSLSLARASERASFLARTESSVCVRGRERERSAFVLFAAKNFLFLCCPWGAAGWPYWPAWSVSQLLNYFKLKGPSTCQNFIIFGQRNWGGEKKVLVQIRFIFSFLFFWSNFAKCSI
jgi:hypothetical protein